MKTERNEKTEDTPIKVHVGGNVGGLADLLGEEGAGGLAGIGGILSFPGKIAEIAKKLQEAQEAGGEADGEGGTRTIDIGGKKAVVHVESGGYHGTVEDGKVGMGTRFGKPTEGGGVKSDFTPEPVVREAPATLIEQPSESAEPEEVTFDLQAFDGDGEINVSGFISGVTDLESVTCTVIEDGAQLQVAVGECVYTVDLGSQVDPGETTANFNNGVFYIKLKKLKTEPDTEE